MNRESLERTRIFYRCRNIGSLSSSSEWLSLIGFKLRNLFDVRNACNVSQSKIIFFHLENSERFVLYLLCGWFIGVAIILLTIIIILYLQQRREKIDSDDSPSPPRDFDYNEILSGTRSILPVYRYDGRTDRGFYQV